MNRKEIEQRIEEVLSPIFMGDGLRVKELTDLFIELSNERIAEVNKKLPLGFILDLDDIE